MNIRYINLSPKKLFKFNLKIIGPSNKNQKLALEKLISISNLSKNVKYCGSIGLLLIEKSMIKGIRAILKVSTNTNKILRIKIAEVTNLLKDLSERHSIKDKDVLTMLRYYELIKELKNIKG